MQIIKVDIFSMIQLKNIPLNGKKINSLVNIAKETSANFSFPHRIKYILWVGRQGKCINL